jgi:hypothetical protein
MQKTPIILRPNTNALIFVQEYSILVNENNIETSMCVAESAYVHTDAPTGW